MDVVQYWTHWRCFAVAGSGNLDCMKDVMNSLKYKAILANGDVLTEA